MKISLYSPFQVLSSYFIGDAFIYLDRLLDKKLFKPTKDINRCQLGGCEGVKGRRLMGALRTLWRSSSVGAHDPRILDLKTYLKHSPPKAPPAAAVSRRFFRWQGFQTN